MGLSGKEDFTTWTETNGEQLSQTAARATWTTLEIQDNDLLYKDFGVDPIPATFIYYWTMRVTSIDPGDTSNRHFITMMTMKTTIPSPQYFTGYPMIRMTCQENGDSSGNYYFYLTVDGTGTQSTDNAFLVTGTIYYCEMVRDNSGEDVTLYIRTGSHTGTLVDTLVTGHIGMNGKTFRYVKVGSGFNTSLDGTDDSTGYFENFTDTLAWGHKFNSVDTPGVINSVAGEDVDKVNSVQA